MTYAYIRVSTLEQNEDRQIDAMKNSGVKIDRVFVEKASGKNFARPQWEELVSTLRSGDLLVIKSLDRMGRSYDGIIEQWKLIVNEIGANICVLDMPILDTRSDNGLIGKMLTDLVLAVLSFVAQNEREMMLQRQAEAYAAALARGTKPGRPEREYEGLEAMQERVSRGEITVAAACKELNMPRSQWYKRAKSA